MKENICCYHNDIKMFADKIKKLSNQNWVDNQGKIILLDTLNEINQYASEITKLAKEAKVAGQHMENRLQVYKDGIESLGFSRKKRKKYERK